MAELVFNAGEVAAWLRARGCVALSDDELKRVAKVGSDLVPDQTSAVKFYELLRGFRESGFITESMLQPGGWVE